MKERELITRDALKSIEEARDNLVKVVKDIDTMLVIASLCDSIAMRLNNGHQFSIPVVRGDFTIQCGKDLLKVGFDISKEESLSCLKWISNLTNLYMNSGNYSGSNAERITKLITRFQII